MVSELRREVGLFGAVAYGVGTIVGAGIYALIGVAAGRAGNAVWLAFVISAILAAFTGLSYVRLSALFPVSGAEYVYVEEASGSRFWAFLVGWLVMVSGVISGSAVALGFGGYLTIYVGVPAAVLAIILIVILSAVNYIGIRESMLTNVVLTSIELAGIVIMVALGLGHFSRVDYLQTPNGYTGIISAVGLIFFAYIGFEGLVKIGEETRNPTRTIPLALVISLLISTVLYVLVALSVVSILPYQQLASSSAPLADVARQAGGETAYIFLSVIALVSTANTVLLILIATSRIAYGMSRESALPKFLALVHPVRGTPRTAIVFTMLAAALFCVLGSIELTANIANFTIFLVFLAVNLALIVLMRKRGMRGMVTVAFAVLGAITSAFMLTQFDIVVVAASALITVLGALVYRLVAFELR